MIESGERDPRDRSAPWSHGRHDPARRQCTHSSVSTRHLIRHNAPRLSSIRLAGHSAPHTSETPSLHHDRGTATPPVKLKARPITVSFHSLWTRGSYWGTCLFILRGRCK